MSRHRSSLPPVSASLVSYPLLRWIGWGLAGGVLISSLWGCATTPLRPAGAPLPSPPTAGVSAWARPVRTIVIDAGHGGRDPGTSHFGLKEKALTLDIARRLRALLQEEGVTVAMTRDADRFIPLSGRPAVANRLDADLFVSVHANANHNQRISGVEAYYPRASVVSSNAEWPPSVSHDEIGIPSTTVKQILWDLVLGRTRAHSRKLASSICYALRDGVDAPCRAVKPARFVVLREAWMPSVLVEVGYVSNEQEARRLGSAEYRQAIARSIAEGIVSYMRELGVEHI